MLKGISPILTPDLLKVLAEMGHGDELVIGDCNFPAASMGQRCVRQDGQNADELLNAILDLFPLDTYVEAPVTLMRFGAFSSTKRMAHLRHSAASSRSRLRTPDSRV